MYFFISTSIITSGIVFLIKKGIDKFLESRIEKYKNSLHLDAEIFKHNLNFESEKLKQELNIASIEYQIKYSKL